MTEYEDSPRDDNNVSISTTDDGIQLNFSVRPPTNEEVTEQIARRLMLDYNNSQKLHTMVGDTFTAAAREWIDKHAQSIIRTMLEEPRQRYDRFGKPEGEPRSLLDDLDMELGSFLNTKVNSLGEPITDGYASQSAPTRFQRLVVEAAAADYQKLAKARVAELNREVRQMVKDKMSSAVDEAIRSLGK